MSSWDERWRFIVLRGSNPRDVLETQDLDCLQDVSTVREVRGPEHLEIVEDLAFPNVSKDFATDSEFDEPWCSPLMSADPIHLKKAHALLSAVKHLSRNQKAHGLRSLVLSDSMCVALAVSKGRASNRAFNRCCHRIAAEALSSGSKLHARWISSECNTSDQGSHVWEALRHPDERGLANVRPDSLRAASAAHAARRSRAAETSTAVGTATRLRGASEAVAEE